MKNLHTTLGRLALAFTGALALGSCNRAEYATLPRSTSYLGSTTMASTPRTVPKAIAATPAPAEAANGQAPAEAAQALVSTAPTTVVPAVAPAPAVAASSNAIEAPKGQATPASPKLNLVQRLALTKVTKKINKLVAKAPQFKQHDGTASTARIDGNLRTGILLILLGLVISLLGFAANIFGVIGGIIAIIGLVFIILWLLDQA